VVLRLIKRQPGSTLALPRDGAESLEKEEEIPWYFAAEVMDYARVMKGSEEYMNEQYDDEVEELQQQEREDEIMFGEDTSWTKKAVSAIIEAKGTTKGLGNPPSAPQHPNERRARRPPVDFHRDVPDHYLVHHAARSGQSLSGIMLAAQGSQSRSSSDQSRAATSTSPDKDHTAQITPSTGSAVSSGAHSKSATSQTEQQLVSRFREGSAAQSHVHHSDSPYYFYEVLLHYYLSPLDIRILKAAFGDFALFPATILPQVERVSTGHIVDDDLRRRAKYLAHLPQGCEVGFLECNWTDVVPADILELFGPEIERRRKKNWEKEAREEKERARAEKKEDDERWAAARRRRPTPAQDSILEAGFEPLPEAPVADFASSPPWSSSRAQDGSSFASLASPSTSPIAGKSVWGTRIPLPTSPVLPAIPDEHDLPGNDGWLQDWERDLLQETDVVAQVEASTLEAGSSKQGAMSANSKKKKGKKITLMSTNARRGA